MKRLTHEADFGLEDWEETLFSVQSDPNGAYDILDIAKYQGEPEFDEILKSIALRLSEIENVLGDDYNLSLIRHLVEAERDGRIIVMKYAEREGVARLRELAEADREGRCIVLDQDTVLSMLAGSSAIRQNNRLCLSTYLFDMKKKYGGPFQIDYIVAEENLRKIGYAALKGENHG